MIQDKIIKKARKIKIIFIFLLIVLIKMTSSEKIESMLSFGTRI